MASEEKEKNHEKTFRQEVGKKEARKLKMRRNKDEKRILWQGLGLFGIVGWSIAIPTFIGAAIGIWIDQKHPGPYSWTLILLTAGLLTGCFIAWQWVNNERKQIDKERNNERHY